MAGIALLRDVVIIAHRGASAHAPENTLLAFDKAWEIGAHMIELDVHETADNHLVVIHDHEVSRCTNGTGEVSELTYDEVRNLNAGNGQKIPSLEEVLEFAYGKIGVNIELKVPDIEKRVLDLVSKKGMIDKIFISSFLHGTLNVVRNLQKSVPTSILFSKPIDDLVNYSAQLGVSSINPTYEMVDEILVSSTHSAGMKLYPWTVNDKQAMIHLLRLGVDGIITDDPELCIRTFESIMI
ncbi:MAG: glycerophosphodiester phosphodiesterase [Candidatus Thorarchaeota archaeon]|jgi:glycerophosphoryl diester phosphodiesterase